jgi:hypothetical protein
MYPNVQGHRALDYNKGAADQSRPKPTEDLTSIEILRRPLNDAELEPAAYGDLRLRKVAHRPRSTYGSQVGALVRRERMTSWRWWMALGFGGGYHVELIPGFRS